MSITTFHMKPRKYNIKTVSLLEKKINFVLILSWSLDAMFKYSYFNCIQLMCLIIWTYMVICIFQYKIIQLSMTISDVDTLSTEEHGSQQHLEC